MHNQVLLLIEPYIAFKTMAANLRQHGFAIFSTEHPEDVIKIITHNQIDTVILQDSLAGVAAEKILGDIRQAGLSTPIILLTKQAESNRQNFSQVIQSPHTPEDLLEAISQIRR
jgi:DNA-binding response OmpR family regulator